MLEGGLNLCRQAGVLAPVWEVSGVALDRK